MNAALLQNLNLYIHLYTLTLSKVIWKDKIQESKDLYLGLFESINTREKNSENKPPVSSLPKLVLHLRWWKSFGMTSLEALEHLDGEERKNSHLFNLIYS